MTIDNDKLLMNTTNNKIWNGEFGPVYASPEDPDHEEINQQRYNLLGEQLSIYKADKISWSIWLYKDIGFQGDYLPSFPYLLRTLYSLFLPPLLAPPLSTPLNPFYLPTPEYIPPHPLNHSLT